MDPWNAQVFLFNLNIIAKFYPYRKINLDFCFGTWWRIEIKKI